MSFLCLKILKPMKKTTEKDDLVLVAPENEAGFKPSLGLPPIVYGLEGIMTLFKVKKTTAWRLRSTVIADACAKQGKTLLVDTKKALELFGLKNIPVQDMPSDMIDIFKLN